MIRFCFLLMFGLLLGCSDDNAKVNYRLTSKERQKVDTLVARQLRIMRPRIDSLCDLHFETKVAAATDSIIQLRLEQEARLRNRIPLNRNR